MADPNFPANLNIFPLDLAGSNTESHDQKAAIEKYGIAGRIWEASGPLIEYLTPGKAAFDPPCSLFATPGPHVVVELGSGQALASLHLAEHLTVKDTVVLTDLPNVVPLCQRSIDSWAERIGEADHARVIAEPLAWGEDASHLKPLGHLTHILMCDLVYFPHLYPPLLRTLLELTEPDEVPETETFGPQIIFAWKSRQLGLEESFFDSFSRYFRMEPVMGVQSDEVKLFLCQRWRVTSEWKMPDQRHVMAGAPGVVQGRGYGLIDTLFGSMEWD